MDEHLEPFLSALDSWMSLSNRPLSPQDVGTIVASVTRLNLPQKERLVDEMFHTQPNVLGTALVATRATLLSMATHDVVSANAVTAVP